MKTQEEVNAANFRAQIEEHYGQSWDTEELRQNFDVQGFAAPFVVATRKADNVTGSLEFTHFPRLYFSWRADK